MIVALFTELLSIGGIQNAGRQTAAALASIARDQGWPVRFLSLNDPSGDHESPVGSIHFQFRGFGRNKPSFVLDALRVGRAQPQIIFAVHPHLGPISRAMKFLAPRSRVIIGTHGIEVWRPLSFPRRSALRRADIVLAPSTDTARRVAVVQSVRENRIRKLPWPLDPDLLALAATATSLPLPAEFPRGRIILSVARWSAAERYKGADLLLQTFSELAKDFPDIHLVLAGPGDDLPRLRGLAHQSNSADKIHFFPDLSREHLVACYSHSHVFALPSTGEGFGLVFLEAMALAKPVIGTRLGGISDILQDGCEGLLLQSPTSRCLLTALRTLLSDESLRREMGLRARERVFREFRFEMFTQRLGNILSETPAGTLPGGSNL